MPVIILLPNHNDASTELSSYTFFKQYKVKELSLVTNIITLDTLKPYFECGGIILIKDIINTTKDIISIVEYVSKNNVNEHFRLLFEFYSDENIPPCIYNISTIYLKFLKTVLINILRIC